MKKYIFLATLVASIFPSYTFATDVQDYPEVDCTRYAQYNTSSKDQCFEGGRVYQGRKVYDLGDDFVNKSNRPLFWMETGMQGESGFKVQFNELQNAIWTMDKGMFKIQGDLDISRSGKKFKIFYPGRHELMKADPGKGITLINVPNTADRNKPVMKMTYTTHHYDSREVSSGLFAPNGGPIQHKEHVFYYAAWCGDGVVDSQFGEKFDDGKNNGKPGFASTDCRSKSDIPPPPVNGVCDGASVGIPSYSAPTNLCKTGTPSVVVDRGNKFTWSCGGKNNGTTVSCEAPKKQDALCGSVNGTIVSTTPNTNLCAVGTATKVSGNNPYSWTCQGVNGGNNVSCGTTPVPPPSEVPTPKPTPAVCDQTFHKVLRYNPNAIVSYGFADLYTNNNSYPHTLESFNVVMKESSDMNKDGSLTYNKFEWATNNRTIPANAKNVKVIHANPPYQLLVPPTKRQKDNIYIEYTINGKGKENFSHKECISYEVTWCGDGIVDGNEGEQCDPNDPNKKNWGTGGCNSQCKPIEKPKANLEIKKYVKEISEKGDSQSNPMTVARGETFNYYYVFENKDSVAINNVFLKDTFPEYLTFNGAVRVMHNNKDVTDDFIIKTGKISVNNKDHITLTASKKTPLVANSGKYTFTVPTKIADNAPNNFNLANMVYICGDNITGTPKDPNGNKVCDKDPRTCEPNDPSCVPTPPPKQCTPEDNPYRDPACITIKNDLEIKKYVKEISEKGDSQSNPMTVARGETFNYYYVFENTNSEAVSNVVLKDTFPEYLSFNGNITVTVNGKDVTNDWTIEKGQKEFAGKNHIYLVMKKKTPLEANSARYTVTVPTTLSDKAPNDTSLQNMVYICGDNVTGTPKDPNGKDVCGNNDIPPPPQPNQCTPENNPKKDPACITVETNALEIKKYAGNKDGQQSGDALLVDKGSDFTYKYVVKSGGNKDQTHVTVTDLFPYGVTVKGFQSVPNGWTCNYGSKIVEGKTHSTVVCHTPKMAKNTSVEIIVKAHLEVNATSGSYGLRNIAYVCSEEVPGKTPNPGTNPGGKTCQPQCTDPNNPSCTPPIPPKECSPIPENPHYDPACIIPPPPSGGGSPTSYITLMCVGTAVVEKTFANEYSCKNEWDSEKNVNKKYSGGCLVQTFDNRAKLESERVKIQQFCTNPPGPGGGGGGNPYCGDGVLNPGEQCDPGIKNSGTRYCDANCKLPKLNPTTNPGANPIEYMIEVPGFGKLGGTAYNKKFHENGVVVGLYSNVFTLADRIRLEMEPAYPTPIQIEADRNFVITSDTNSTAFGNVQTSAKITGDVPSWTYNNKKYFVIGVGDLLVPNGATTHNLTCTPSSGIYQRCIPSLSTRSVELFKGSDLQGFKANKVARRENITLGIQVIGSSDVTSLASFPVQVTSSKVAMNGSTIARQIKSFENFQKVAVNFINKLQNTTSTSQNIDTSWMGNNFGKSINANIQKTGNLTIKSVDDLKNYTHNGNPNIYALKGNLTFENCANNTFTMKGVKTILVEGDITFKCNTGYESNDNNSSWAFIAKGGNIIVDETITNLAGVFATLPENGNGGKITQKNATANILRIDGTLYGKAEELFEKRTYARATDSYKILTTGTVLNYSNRALRNPPPLLSQYLNAYQVQRVVR